MHRNAKLIIPGLCGLLTGFQLLGGCSPRMDPLPPVDPNEVRTASVCLPFVESVELPSEIHAGAEFNVVLHLGAQAKPEMLTWIDAAGTWLHGFQGGVLLMNPKSWPAGNYDMVRPWVSMYSTPGEPVGTVTLTLVAAEPGPRVLRIQSAETADLGGIEGEFVQGPDSDDDTSPGTVYRDYPYTVLPAEGGIARPAARGGRP